MALLTGNVETSTSTTILFKWVHRVFTGGEYRFQRYSEEPIVLDGASYAFKEWLAPTAMGRTTEATNRQTYLGIPLSSFRTDSSFPLKELMRGFDGLTGTVIQALEIENHTQAVIRSTFYQVRSAGMVEADVIFELQCAGLDPGWATIPAISPSFQRR
jgi:hypothetical protein